MCREPRAVKNHIDIIVAIAKLVSGLEEPVEQKSKLEKLFVRMQVNATQESY